MAKDERISTCRHPFRSGASCDPAENWRRMIADSRSYLLHTSSLIDTASIQSTKSFIPSSTLVSNLTGIPLSF